MARTAKANTTARGLGHRHRQQVDILFRKLVDGSLCWWCNRPMHKDPTKNWDARTLAGDHTVPRSVGGTLADRLLHATCNEQRGDGSRDDTRPSLTGTRHTTPPPRHLAMEW